MARLHVKWTETSYHEAEIEVDGFDPDAFLSGQIDPVLNKLDILKLEMGRDGPEVTHYEVIREGEPTPDIPVAKQTESGFDF